MNMQYILPVIMLAALGAFAFFRMSKMSGALANSGPGMHAFFQHTGYRYEGMAPEPVESHAQRAVADMQRLASQGGDKHCIRNVQGVPIRWSEGSKITDSGYAFWSEWSAAATHAPRVLVHIADRSLGGLGKAVGEVFSNIRSDWSPRYPVRVQTGIPQVDERLAVFGNDPAAVQAFLHQNPALVAMLLRCAHVDLWNEPHRAAFADPMQKNVTAALGGTSGQVALAFDVAKRMELSIPVHDHIGEILATMSRSA
jgi:hypothetical protein